VNGNNPAMRDFFIALESLRWCLAQVPVYRGDFILYKGSKNLDNVSASLKSISLILFLQK